MQTKLSLAHLRSLLKDFQVHAHIQKDAYPYDIWTALNYIETHIYDPDFSITRLRFECDLNNNNLSSRFKIYVGVEMRRYVEQRRIEAAKELLAKGDFNIYHIAATVGYVHPETFCRAFKRVEGCTPSSYQL